MRHNLYYNSQNSESKCNWVMRSLLKGWSEVNRVQSRQNIENPLLPGHFWGFIENNAQLIKQLKDNGVDWYFWDMPYYGRWLNDAEKTWYWRVSRNRLHYSYTCDRPDDRFRRWNKQPKPYRPGNKILICPSSETMTRFTTGWSVEEWVDVVTRRVKKHTDMPILVRYKPRANGTSGPGAATVPIEHELHDAHCVVTSISLSAMEAQFEGVPTICHADSFAADISSTSLNINNLVYPSDSERQQWFNNLAYSQFTHDEIESGLAQEILNA